MVDTGHIPCITPNIRTEFCPDIQARPTLLWEISPTERSLLARAQAPCRSLCVIQMAIGLYTYNISIESASAPTLLKSMMEVLLYGVKIRRKTIPNNQLNNCHLNSRNQNKAETCIPRRFSTHRAYPASRARKTRHPRAARLSGDEGLLRQSIAKIVRPVPRFTTLSKHAFFSNCGMISIVQNWPAIK